MHHSFVRGFAGTSIPLRRAKVSRSGETREPRNDALGNNECAAAAVPQ